MVDRQANSMQSTSLLRPDARSLPTSSTLGRRLRAARVAKGRNRAQLGERLLGMAEWDDPSTAAPRISRYQRGMDKP